MSTIKVKTHDLIGWPLDYAVILAKYPKAFENKPSIKNIVVNYPYSTNWSQAGPIINQENISLDNRKGEPCRAFKGTPVQYEFSVFAPEGKPLTAAMRCFVASKLGEEINVPQELFATNA